MKQNKYPVLFLCVGDTQRYTPFQDQRTSTSLTAVNFAAGADLLVSLESLKIEFKFGICSENFSYFIS